LKKRAQTYQGTQGVVAFATNLALGLCRMFGIKNVLSEIQFRYKIQKVLYITFYWVIVSLAQDLYDMLVMNNFSGEAVNLAYFLTKISRSGV
jgi:hypothetical protein